MAPVRYEPGGTTTLPPPAFVHRSIARRKANVQSVRPSPFAPNSVRSNVRIGKRGRLMRLTIEGITVSHGFASAANADRRGDTAITAPPANRSLMNSRRDDMLFLPRWIIFFQQLCCAINIPFVTCPSLVFDLGHVVFEDSIAPRKDWAVRANLVKARPR